ncbi:hypothetical protein [Methylocapsa palsarum]|uniref:Uncharacterized protein n=1 Tax=Methylocapsa palsarum TaxID=1612308 RepID=A0A1I3VX56_9HYPH|nr:hypothetical protein [Methylocapsa palsarum]SFJ98721.1 hypothetical protein SAMN05444581_101102 [Methylocapsa palsarum]
MNYQVANYQGANVRTAIVPSAMGRPLPSTGRAAARGRADSFAYKGRPAAKPKAPPPAPKGAPEPAPEAPKPPQPEKEAGAS